MANNFALWPLHLPTGNGIGHWVLASIDSRLDTVDVWDSAPSANTAMTVQVRFCS